MAGTAQGSHATFVGTPRQLCYPVCGWGTEHEYVDQSPAEQVVDRGQEARTNHRAFLPLRDLPVLLGARTAPTPREVGCGGEDAWILSPGSVLLRETPAVGGCPPPLTWLEPEVPTVSSLCSVGAQRRRVARGQGRGSRRRACAGPEGRRLGCPHARSPLQAGGEPTCGEAGLWAAREIPCCLLSGTPLGLLPTARPSLPPANPRRTLAGSSEPRLKPPLCLAQPTSSWSRTRHRPIRGRADACPSRSGGPESGARASRWGSPVHSQLSYPWDGRLGPRVHA